MHKKDFKGWNIEKQRIHELEKNLYFKEREIWWIALGINIGVETDGKNNAYERPVLILKRINRYSAIVIPLTTQGKEDKYRAPISTNNMNSFAKISQIKTISTKRLLRKVDTLPTDQYEVICQRIAALFASNIESAP